MSTLDRRQFLSRSTMTGVALASGAVALNAVRPARAAAANDTITLAVMGTNGRGAQLAKMFAALPGAQIAYICDVDSRAVEHGIRTVTDASGKAPQGAKDFRTALDDQAVDALVCAAPDHWHAPATILACSAEKHVYVEKPCSHNPREGELAVEAARKYRRVVTMGSQRRSAPLVREAIDKVRGGAIGRVTYSRSWYNNRRTSIGRGKPAPVPEWLDYTLWQGPAPERPYHDNVIHYNWHWFWHWGTGELGNNGVHSLDVSRWGLGVDFPTRVVAGGGKRTDDDQETPDTHLVVCEFGDKTISWEGLSWSPRGHEQTGFGVSFHGDQGTLVLAGDGYRIFDVQDKEIEHQTGDVLGDTAHLTDFLDSIRGDRRPNADIAEAHKSTLLCHLGNISQRTGRALKTDPADGHILDDLQAAQLWQREYRPGWAPTV